MFAAEEYFLLENLDSNTVITRILIKHYIIKRIVSCKRSEEKFIFFRNMLVILGNKSFWMG